MHMFVIAAVAVAAFSVAFAATAEAAQRRAKVTVKSKAPHQLKRDCTPINGRYGYYGNPWCDADAFRNGEMFRAHESRGRKAIRVR